LIKYCKIWILKCVWLTYNFFKNSCELWAMKKLWEVVSCQNWNLKSFGETVVAFWKYMWVGPHMSLTFTALPHRHLGPQVFSLFFSHLSSMFPLVARNLWGGRRHGSPMHRGGDDANGGHEGPSIISPFDPPLFSLWIEHGRRVHVGREGVGLEGASPV
jgi:hypothetical protein